MNPSSTRTTLALALLWAAVSLHALGDRELWNPMEPRYAGIATTMFQTGDWLVPRYEGALYDQKPPLYFWAVAGAQHLLGEDSRFALRWPSALGALLAGLAASALGRIWFGSRAAFWCGAVTLCSFLVFWSSRFGNLDTLTAAGLAIAVLGVERAAGGAGLRGLLLIGAGTWLGLMTKGPLVPGALLLWALVRLAGDWQLTRRTLLPLVGGLFLAAGAFAAWYVPARMAAGAAWGDALLFGQGVDRHLAKALADRHGRFYYLRVLWSSSAPFSLLLPTALWWHLRSRAARRRARPVLAYALVLLVVLSLYPIRRERYWTPAVPAFGVLLGAWASILASRLAHRLPVGLHCGSAGFVAVVAAAAGLLVAIIGVAPVVLEGFVEETASAGRALASIREAWLVRGLLVLLALSAVLLAVRALLTRDGRGALGALVLASVMTWTGFASLVVPAADAARDDRALLNSLRMIRQMTPASVVVVGPIARRESTSGWFHWYLGTEPVLVPTLGDFEKIDRSVPHLLLIRSARLEVNPELLPADARPVETDPIGHAGFEIHLLPPRQ